MSNSMSVSSGKAIAGGKSGGAGLETGGRDAT
jgi:hypothetical protein